MSHHQRAIIKNWKAEVAKAAAIKSSTVETLDIVGKWWKVWRGIWMSPTEQVIQADVLFEMLEQLPQKEIEAQLKKLKNYNKSMFNMVNCRVENWIIGDLPPFNQPPDDVSAVGLDLVSYRIASLELYRNCRQRGDTYEMAVAQVAAYPRTAVMCGHANESPNHCDCPGNCHCRVYGYCRRN